MGPDLTTHPGVLRVRAALAEAGHPVEVRTLTDSARTAAEAAAALGVEVSQIANSLVFRATVRDGARRPVLVLASGGRRVDTSTVADTLGVLRLDRAEPELVRASTGFAIGGVSPVGHPSPLPTVVDLALAQHEVVWAAAGHPHAVFATTYEALLRLTGGKGATVVPPA